MNWVRIKIMSASVAVILFSIHSLVHLGCCNNTVDWVAYKQYLLQFCRLVSPKVIVPADLISGEDLLPRP